MKPAHMPYGSKTLLTKINNKTIVQHSSQRVVYIHFWVFLNCRAMQCGMRLRETVSLCSVIFWFLFHLNLDEFSKKKKIKYTSKTNLAHQISVCLWAVCVLFYLFQAHAWCNSYWMSWRKNKFVSWNGIFVYK